MDINASRLLDEYLLASARAGDRRSFDALAGRWQRKLIAHACSELPKWSESEGIAANTVGPACCCHDGSP